MPRTEADIRDAIAECETNLIMWTVANFLEEDQAVIDGWQDRVYMTFDGFSTEDLAYALTLAILGKGETAEAAQRILTDLRSVTG